jgi:cytochrome c551/c552
VRLPRHRPTARSFQKYCVTCHSNRLKTAGLSLQNVDPAAPAIDGRLWEKA